MSEFEEKVLKILEGMDKKLDKLISSEIERRRTESSSSTVATASVAVSNPSSSAMPSPYASSIQTPSAPEETSSIETRKTCPDCGGTTFNTLEDKTKLLHSMGGVKIYAKKYVCKSCGKEL